MRMPSMNLWLAALLSLGAMACGGDDAAAPGAAVAAAPKAGAAAAGPGKAKLDSYPKIEDRVPPDERKTIRHTFHERDFAPDPTGTENRDPFRSYVIEQIIGPDHPDLPQAADELCTSKQMKASNYSVRDLRLVGIVSEGTRRYALFQDTADVGQIIYRGDCVGKEKARVKDSGDGFVTLETVPEVLPNQPVRPPEDRSIPLYPEELPVAEDPEGGPPVPVKVKSNGPTIKEGSAATIRSTIRSTPPSPVSVKKTNTTITVVPK